MRVKKGRNARSSKWSSGRVRAPPFVAMNISCWVGPSCYLSFWRRQLKKQKPFPALLQRLSEEKALESLGRVLQELPPRSARPLAQGLSSALTSSGLDQGSLQTPHSSAEHTSSPPASAGGGERHESGAGVLTNVCCGTLLYVCLPRK